MNNSIFLIGGADGPTSVFLAGSLGIGWINLWGLIIVVLMLVPNIIYAIKEKNMENKCTNKLMNILEQIGRYGCMFLMVVNLGLKEFGFPAVEAFLVYLFGNVLLMASYWLIWVLYFREKRNWKQIALAVIPTCIFMLCGVTLRHYLLIVFAIIFGVGHIYVTRANKVE